MFDIGFMELVLIGIVALLVVGPEKLPGAIRTGALWVGRAKRSFNQVKNDIEREINADEIRRQLHNESILADIEKAKKGANQLIDDTKKDLDSINTDVSNTLTKEKQELEEALQPSQEGQDPEGTEGTEGTPDTETASAEPTHATTESPASAEQVLEPNPEPIKPVEDFYNNPPAGVIRLQGGVFQQ